MVASTNRKPTVVPNATMRSATLPAVATVCRTACVLIQQLAEPMIHVHSYGISYLVWESAVRSNEIHNSVQLRLMVAVDHDKAHLFEVKPPQFVAHGHTPRNYVTNGSGSGC